MYDIIHHFKMYSSMIVIIFRVMQPLLQSILDHFDHSNKKKYSLAKTAQFLQPPQP